MSGIIQFFTQLGLSDIFDVLLVSFLIYRFFLIIQGTRAVQMLLGIFFLFAVYWTSLSFELFSLNWLLNHFFDYFFVIIIIIFQDQVKSALVTIGETGKLFGNKSALALSGVEEIISTTLALSRERTGGLIVIEKQHGLLNFALTGTMVDCPLHSDILYSFFQPKSPLHDGAVIIKGGKIQAAGCFLPLSKNIEIDRHLGTRHRAALGLSEICDAVIVVISEETGNIQLCFYGNFLAINNETELRTSLKNLLRSTTPLVANSVTSPWRSDD